MPIDEVAIFCGIVGYRLITDRIELTGFCERRFQIDRHESILQHLFISKVQSFMVSYMLIPKKVFQKRTIRKDKSP